MFNVSIFISGFTLLLRHPMESLPSVFDSQIRSVCVHMENQPQGFWLLWVSESCRDVIKKKSQNWFLSTTWECLVIKQNPFVTAKCRAGPCGILTLACGIGWSVCCSFYCSYAVFFLCSTWRRRWNDRDQWVWENKCAEESRLSPTFCHCVLPEQCGNRHVCVFVLVHVYPWNDEIQLDLSETRVDLLLPQGGDDSAWRSSSSLPSVLAAACVCVCVCFWSKEAVVVFLCRDLASGSMCPVKTNATCLWFGHSTFCTCCSIFVFAVLLVFWGVGILRVFLHRWSVCQWESVSVREWVCMNACVTDRVCVCRCECVCVSPCRRGCVYLDIVKLFRSVIGVKP